MKADITIGVETDEPIEKLVKVAAGALRERGVRVIAEIHAKREQPYTVLGSIKGKPDESYRTVVQAENAADAEEKAVAEEPRRTVVAVLEGEVTAAR